ncbi:MAG: DUF5689 domain-containing protein [Bacteroidota bacterium]
MKSVIPVLGMLLVFGACVEDRDFDALNDDCTNSEANVSFSEVKALYKGELLQIQEDWIIEGYVISSDRASNFFSVLYFQDDPVQPTEGFQIEIDVRDNHLLFPVGSKILIKLKGLYLGQSRDVFKLGGTFAAFGTISVGRLPALKVPEHIFIACQELTEILPRTVTIPEINSTMTSTLVQLEGLEIMDQELDSVFATAREETERTLTDCSDNELILVNSGFSDFQAELLPQGNGSIQGVLVRENDDFFLVIRDLEDINFNNERCEDVVTEFTSAEIFFSELADPNNNAEARFMELYNASSTPLNLNGWVIRRYTNANTEVSSILDLSELVIAAKSTLVISPNANEFERVYGFPPDLGVGANSPADSNGDDNMELVDPFGTIIDRFGVIGEDGSGTSHEFEDGRAVRNSQILKANTMYTFSEWTIFNDTGAVGTINEPQNAPEDFTPGMRD